MLNRSVSVKSYQSETIIEMNVGLILLFWIPYCINIESTLNYCNFNIVMNVMNNDNSLSIVIHYWGFIIKFQQGDQLLHSPILKDFHQNSRLYSLENRFLIFSMTINHKMNNFELLSNLYRLVFESLT